MEANKLNETMQPTHTELVSSWMATYHRGCRAAVFFAPVGDGDRVNDIKERLCLDESQVNKLICCDVYIHTISGELEELCAFVNFMDQEVYGYVAAWDGTSFISNN